MASPSAASSKVWNIPNQITAARLFLSIVVFLLISFEQYLAAMICFIIAAATDWIDGYWGRKYNQVTQLGRIFDPFVDKIIICGTFIFLAAEWPQSGIAPWMAVVVMGREMLVTVLRSVIENAGGDFSANQAGKWKMLFQCVAVVTSLLALYLQPRPEEKLLYWTLHISVWLAVLSTIYSGVIYIFAAARQMPK